MKYIAREQIKDLFTNPQRAMMNGLWFSGYKSEGEYKEWYKNGQLTRHCFYKNDELDGEYKRWHENGQLWVHCFYKQGEKDGKYKSWFDNGKLYKHYLFKDGEVVKDYLK